MISTESPAHVLERLEAQLDHATTLADPQLQAEAYNQVVMQASVHVNHNHQLNEEERGQLLALQRLADALRAAVVAAINAQPLPFTVAQ